jgi:polar amino acid transport system permease protein
MGYVVDFSFVWRHRNLFINGFLLTLWISCWAMLLGMAVGLGMALLSTSRFPWLQRIARAYVEFIRNIPLLMILFLVYFGLPREPFYITLSEENAAIVGLGIYAGAYLTEIFRAAILAVGRGQIEAAKALGLTPLQSIRKVILPQAWRILLPSLSNQLISTTKDSSLAYAISVKETMFAGIRLNDLTWRYVEAFVPVWVIYLSLSYGIAFLLRLCEKYYAKRS